MPRSINLPKMHKPPMPKGYRLPDYNELAKYAPELAVDMPSGCHGGNVRRRLSNMRKGDAK